MSNNGPRIATIDIETYPAVVESWGLHNQFHTIEQVRDPGGMLGFGVKWHGSRKVEWFGLESLEPSDLALAAREYLHAADIVVTFNGDRFDLPIMNREIALAALSPPSSSKSVDLYRITRNKFRFLSNKLDFVAQALEVGSKASTGGYDLWRRCMAGDPAAFRKMAAYCKQDVRVTEGVYDKLLPWITNHPNVSLWSNDASPFPSCPKCGSYDLNKDGFEHAVQWSYQRYQCRQCGGHARGIKMLRKATSGTVNAK